MRPANKLRYFVAKPGAAGPRYFWQPSTTLRRAGFRAERLSDDPRQAAERAAQLNHQVDQGRCDAVDTTPARRTLAGVIDTYQASRFFTELRASTRQSYAKDLRFLRAWGGERQVSLITPQTVETLYQSLKQTPAKAAHVITILRVVMEAARRQGIITANPASRPGIRGAVRDPLTWPPAAVELFIAKADQLGLASIGTALRLNHWIGQREGDILALPRTAFAGGRITLRQSKTNAQVSIPDNATVRARIAATLLRLAPAPAGETEIAAALPLLICEPTGRPWKADHFRHCFAAVRTCLALDHPTIAYPDGRTIETQRLLFRHLRHTAVTQLADAGCTLPEIAAITGHSLHTLPTMIAHYLVRTTEQATAAMARRSAHEARHGH